MSSGVSVIGLVRNISSSMLVSVFCTGAEREERISFEPASQTTLCLVVARGETSRDATRRGLLNRGNDSRLLGFFFRHGHGHHRDAATDGDARADETRQRENGHGHVHSLTARHLDFCSWCVLLFSFLFVLSRRRASSRRSSVKPLKRVASRSQTSIHPYVCMSVCLPIRSGGVRPNNAAARFVRGRRPGVRPSLPVKRSVATTPRGSNVSRSTNTIFARASPPSFAPTRG
jgi:hypothetical protein